MNEELDTLCREMITYHGIEAQIRVCVEEIGELLAALMQSYRNKTTSTDIIDEIADVTIMLRQLSIIYGVTETEDRIQYKINLIRTRLEEHKRKLREQNNV